MTNTLEYVAQFGKFGEEGEIETIALTTNVMMTVSLYDTDSSDRRPLWQRRLSVPVWDGQFVVELDDSLGVVDEMAPQPPTYATLADVFAQARPADAWYVGISRVRLGEGTALPAHMDDTEKIDKISAVPFAFEAERAAAARGDFTVAGKATVGTVSVSSGGAFTVKGAARFDGKTTCEAQVLFGESGGLVVAGTLSFKSLDASGRSTVVSAPSVNATTSFSASRLTVTGGDKTTLAFKDDNVSSSLTDVTVRGTLTADAVTAGSAVADTVTVRKLLTLTGGGHISWHAIGAQGPVLAAPDGVYPTGATVTDDSSKGRALNFSNTSGKEQLLTFVIPSHALPTMVYVTTPAVSDQIWAYSGPATVGGAGVTLSSLCPLAATGGDSAQVSAGTLLSHTVKELSK